MANLQRSLWMNSRNSENSTPEPAADALIRQHERTFEANRFVYPVISRRSRGLSIGVNLNPDKICNFDCIYCQVDRTTTSETRFVETEQLEQELTQLLRLAVSGALFDHPKFAATPAALRRVNDIAFSGDGEPTTYRNFDDLMARAAEIKQREAGEAVKMVLITNASMFHRPHVQRGLKILDAHQGEIWAKLDAGTEAYFHQVERTTIPFARILDNLRLAARERPLVIQSLFMKVAGEPPSAAEIEAFCTRLEEIRDAGGAIQLVQVYTVARRPAESYVTPLEDAAVDRIAAALQAAGFPVEAYYSTYSPSDSAE